MTDIQHSFRRPLDISLTLQQERREIDQADETLASAMTKAYDVVEIVNEMAFIGTENADTVNSYLTQFAAKIEACDMLGSEFQATGTALHDAILAARVGPQDRDNRDCTIELLRSIVFSTRRLMCLIAADKATQAVRGSKNV
ncbi:hypothetical protein FDK21_11750 [Cohaesibacter sp. CAU 1516]|uniref:hypothetical protein n=1 Tax=Cohaesibacter sp. CAU 1516 TaxID=2576038 RepID=UPI0010FEE8CD|nr:hypothetical protein [Cohaesibacter sp. CAU 1516]TLP45430.1 hypothetical protein FDK21_11750 [Cohaesibacter sp. CAU 1516]